MSFYSPIFFILLPIAALIVLYARKKDNDSAVRFSSEDLVKGLKPTFKVMLSRNMIYLRLAAALLLILGLARPRSPVADSMSRSEGIEIALALDSSTSMLAEDFTINGRRENRLDVVKKVVADFIKERSDDRIALVTFAARAYTVCPLTLDHAWLLTNLERIKCGMLEDGTAIGSGIATSLNRLKDSEAKSKAVILLTDGRNNTGRMAPLTAAEAAKALKIKIYTIGVGSKGLVPYPARDLFGRKVYQQVEVDIDEDTLKEIASITGGEYFRATDTQSLRSIYAQIDKMEKTPMQERGYSEYNELFPWFVIPGLALFLLGMILANTYLRKVP